MAVKEGNKVIPITFTEPQRIKLGLLCSRTGLSKTNMVQRLIDGVELFAQEKEQLKAQIAELSTDK